MPQNQQSKGNKTEVIGNKVNEDFLNGLHKKKSLKILISVLSMGG